MSSSSAFIDYRADASNLFKINVFRKSKHVERKMLSTEYFRQHAGGGGYGGGELE